MNHINLNEDDLAANREEKLSQRQRERLRQQRLVWLVGSLGIFFIVGGMAAVLFLKALNPAFASRGQLFILLPLALFWLWLLHKSPGQWQRTTRDLRENQVSSVTGSVLAEMSMGIGLFRTLRYRVHIDQYHFGVNQEIFRQFKNGESYRIYYSPHSETFLGALAVVQERDVSADMSAVSPLLLDPLTDREAEILQLIASGLSNKEIAAQLSLSPNTVKMYASQLYQKLGVNRRTEAVARAREIGLLED